MRRWLLALAVASSLGAGALLSACGSDAAPEVPLSAAGERGQTVAREQGCIACHTPNGDKSTGPTWKDLAGSAVTLADGSEVEADDAYLRRAILQSRADVVKGYANVMPVYDGELSDDELDALLAYLHDLSPDAAPSSGSGS